MGQYDFSLLHTNVSGKNTLQASVELLLNDIAGDLDTALAENNMDRIAIIARLMHLNATPLAQAVIANTMVITGSTAQGAVVLQNGGPIDQPVGVDGPAPDQAVVPQPEDKPLITDQDSPVIPLE